MTTGLKIDRRRLTALAGAGSLALILGAWFFQYVIGLAPCAMCYWQRWPHMAAVAIMVLALAALPRAAAIALSITGALAAATSGAIGLYHSGVERGWWPGPASCTGSGQDLGALSGDALLSFEDAPPLVLCDDITWQFLGLTMANYNVLASFAVAAIWVIAARSARSV